MTITLSATDGDDETPTYSTVTAPQHGTLNSNAPNLTYTPEWDYNGADSFIVKANDGNIDSNFATVSITITMSTMHQLRRVRTLELRKIRRRQTI